jgi:hypothetical protein
MRFCVCSAGTTSVTDPMIAAGARCRVWRRCALAVRWREASGDASRCSDRNLHTHPVARCPGPPRDQRALLLGTERRRTRRGPGPSTYGIGRRGTHTPEAGNADRGRNSPDHQQSSKHVKPFDLEGEAIRPRDGFAITPSLRAKQPKWNRGFPYALFARPAAPRPCCGDPRLRTRRQGDYKLRLASSTADIDGAVVRLDDGGDDGQPEAGAAAAPRSR